MPVSHEQLAARAAIIDTTYQYCRAMDRMDKGLTLDCFTENATLSYSGIFEGDAKGFIEWLWPVHSKLVSHVHSLSNCLVSFADQTEPTSESYIMTTLRLEDNGVLYDNIGNGRYFDRWTQEGDRWRIKERAYTTTFTSAIPVKNLDISGHLNLKGKRLPVAAGTRDKSDPSYKIIGEYPLGK
jgi:hypothetical protein